MSDEMVDRVARALAEVDGATADYFDLARAAIEAMREPTDAMVQAAMPLAFTARVSQRELWDKMIDAALGKVDA